MERKQVRKGDSKGQTPGSELEPARRRQRQRVRDTERERERGHCLPPRIVGVKKREVAPGVADSAPSKGPPWGRDLGT